MDYEIIYMKRKTVGLKVESGRLIVKAPTGLSKSEIDSIVERHRRWIFGAMEKDALKRKNPKGSLADSCENVDFVKLKKEALEYFSQKLPYYAGLMNLKYGSLTVTQNKNRFGSCDRAGNIRLSSRLMLFPEAVREYVIVHELAHIVVFNHSPKFYAVIARFLPDYKARIKLMKKGISVGN